MVVGDVINMLTVLEINEDGTGVVCKCSCGNTKITTKKALSGKPKSCGCLQKEAARQSVNQAHKKATTHGLSTKYTGFYDSLKGAISRCYDSSTKNYSTYGAVGIEVCKEWLEDIENYKKDMFDSWKPGLTLERLDLCGNYCKENCTWIEAEFQSRHRGKRRDNTSGVTGVMYERSNKGHERFIAHWTDLNKQTHTKSFSLKKHGKEEAFRLACEYRAKMIEELNNLGAGYSSQHGLSRSEMQRS